MTEIEQKARERAEELAVEITGLTVLHIDRAPEYCSDACGGDLGRENCMAVEAVEILTAALLAWGKEQRYEGLEEAAKTSKEAHYIYCEVSNRYPSEGLAEFQVQCIRRLKEE